jgi:hypothetical protein
VEDTKQYDQINKVQPIVVAEKRKAFEIHIDRQHRADLIAAARADRRRRTAR